MSIHNYLIFLLTILLTSSLLAQERSIQGVVRDADSNDALYGAELMLRTGLDTLYTTSNKEGAFHLRYQQSAKAPSLQVSFIGYNHRH